MSHSRRRTRAPKTNAAKPPARRRVRGTEGVYCDRHGFLATVEANGVQRKIRFPSGTPLKTIRAQRDELRASLRTPHRRRAPLPEPRRPPLPRSGPEHR